MSNLGRARRSRARSTPHGVGLAMVCLLTLLPVVGTAQTEFRLDVEGRGYKRMTLQVLAPEFDTPTADVRATANRGRETLARDLIYSGLFFVIRVCR